MKMNSTLKNAVIRRIGGKQYLEDVYNHGASAGFPGFTYYAGTVKFYRTHKKHIVDMAEDMADSMGMSTIEMVKGFNCLHNDYTSDEIGKVLYGNWRNDDAYTMIANALSWFALEEVAREVFDK
jgi:hypothetical protein